MEWLIQIAGMDFSMILPVLAGLSVVALLSEKLYDKIRPKFSVKVNCWFCNNNTRVPYNSSNSWYCPQCQQYNGFTPDGGYNKFLPELSNGKLNLDSWCKKTNTKRASSNGLCRFCNINLSLKVQQLAQFVPFNKNNYDEEIQNYSEKLERAYRLCSKCQEVLEKTLNEKQEKFAGNRTEQFTFTSQTSTLLDEVERKHTLHLHLIALLSLCLLLTVVPYRWANHLMPTYLVEWASILEGYVSKERLASVFLSLGVLIQLIDSLHMKDSSSLANLVIWIVLALLPRLPVRVDGLISVVHMLASVVFFITSLTEHKNIKCESVEPVKMHQIKKTTIEPVQRNSDMPADGLNQSPLPSPVCPVSDPSPPKTPPSSNPQLDDFGFGKLTVSSKRVTRSQSKAFKTKQYGQSQAQSDIFRPKTFNLSPPKLNFDKQSEYQLPLTRSSSQSSGFVSLSHQKDYEEYRSSSILDDIESISQRGVEDAVVPYRQSSPPFPPGQFYQQYGMQFSNCQPVAIVHLAPPELSSFYHKSISSLYEPSLNLSGISSCNNSRNEGNFQYIKNILSSMLFSILIISNVALIWKVFGEDYFKVKT